MYPIARAAAAVCCVFAVLAQSGCSGTAKSQLAPTPTGSVIAAAQRKPAGTIAGELLNKSNKYALNEDAGHVVVLNWFASWCPPCQIETPKFAEYWNTIKTSDAVRFVGIDAKDTHAAGTEFIQDAGVTYPVVSDSTGQTILSIYRALPEVNLPFTIILDNRHRIAALYLGPIQTADIETALEALKNEG